MARNIDRLTDRSIKAKKARGYYGDGDGLYLQAGAGVHDSDGGARG